MTNSKNTRFTQGTWRQLAVTARVLADLPTGESLIVHDGAPDSLRHVADAQLIADAPSLYRALKRLYKHACKLEGEGFIGSELEAAWLAIEAVESEVE